MVNAVRLLSAVPLLAMALLRISCAAGEAMELTSPNLANGSKLALAQVHTRCGGGNRSPALRWSGAPAKTRGFALTLFDPNAGGEAGFWHWLVFDIPAGAPGLAEDAGSGRGLPPGAVQAANDFGDAGYGGACPPPGSGVHHYQFTLYALDTIKVPPAADANDAALAGYLKAHALATASLVGTYSR